MEHGEVEEQRFEVGRGHGRYEGVEPPAQVCVRVEDMARHGGHVQAVVDEQVVGGVCFGGFSPVVVHGVLARARAAGRSGQDLGPTVLWLPLTWIFTLLPPEWMVCFTD